MMSAPDAGTVCIQAGRLAVEQERCHKGNAKAQTPNAKKGAYSRRVSDFTVWRLEFEV
jgi:hypothetical protein